MELSWWQDCYAVVRGGAEETQALLQNRFDHIFYTGKHQIAACLSLPIADVHIALYTGCKNQERICLGLRRQQINAKIQSFT